MVWLLSLWNLFWLLVFSGWFRDDLYYLHYTIHLCSLQSGMHLQFALHFFARFARVAKFLTFTYLCFVLE